MLIFPEACHFPEPTTNLFYTLLKKVIIHIRIRHSGLGIESIHMRILIRYSLFITFEIDQYLYSSIQMH